jgi:transcriptional regulator with XRE-family HTH domain
MDRRRSEKFGRREIDRIDPNSYQYRAGQLARRRRAQLGLTQQDVARLVYGDEERKSQVSDFERGRNEPQPDTVKRYCDALWMSVDEFEACRFNPSISNSVLNDERKRLGDDFALVHRVADLAHFVYQDAETYGLMESLILEHDLVPLMRRFKRRGVNDSPTLFKLSTNIASFFDCWNFDDLGDEVIEYSKEILPNIEISEDRRTTEAELIHTHNETWKNDEIDFCKSTFGDLHKRTQRAISCRVCYLLQNITPNNERKARLLVDHLVHNLATCEAEIRAIVHIHIGRLAYLYCMTHPDDRQTAGEGIEALDNACQLLEVFQTSHPFLAHIDFFRFALWTVCRNEKIATYYYKRARGVFLLAPYRGICLVRDEDLERSLNLKPRRIPLK